MAAAPLTAPSLVGRTREVERIADALTRRQIVIWVEGEAGIGKTRLVEAVVQRRRHGTSAHTLVATCPPVRRPSTLGPLVDALRRQLPGPPRLPVSPLTAALRALFPEWSGELRGDAEPPEDATAARHRVFRALADLLERADVDSLVVEDVHWADEATIEFLLFVSSGGCRPLPVLVTCRPEDMPTGSLLPRLSRLAAGASGLRVELGPLDVAHTARLVSSMVGGAGVSDEFAATLHDSTEGVPLAIEETMRLLSDKGYLEFRNGQWIRRHLDEMPLPRSIQDVVLERFERLGEEARLVLRASAVIGDPAPESMLGDVSGLTADRIPEALVEGLRGGGLLTAQLDGRTDFAHVLAARAVYENIPTPVRRRMHLRAAHVMVRNGVPDANVAHHFREAGEVQEWLRHGERAVDLAESTGDGAAAAGLVHDLVCSRTLAARDALRLVGKFPFASCARSDWCADLIETLRWYLAGTNAPPDAHAELHCRLGHALGAMCDSEGSRTELEIAADGLADQPELTARTLCVLGWPTVSVLPAEEHLRWVRRAAELRPRLRPRDQQILDIDTASALLMLGDPEGWTVAERVSSATGAHLRRADLPRGQFNIGDMAVLWGRYAEARTRLDTALRLCEEGELVRLRDIVLTSMLSLDWYTGRWDGLRARAEILAANEDLGPVTRLEAAQVAGDMARVAGTPSRAVRHYETVLRGSREFGCAVLLARATAAHAELRLAEGRIDDALDLTRATHDGVVARGIWIWAAELTLVRTRAQLAAGRRSEARDCVEAFGHGMGGLSAPSHQAALTTCRAMLAEADGAADEALAMYTEAAAAWQAMPRPYDALLARERGAMLMIDIGRHEAGVAALQETMSALVRLGARQDADRVAGRLRPLGVDARARPGSGGRRPYGDKLSPREREVVRLVVAGHTNQQIADQLFRSPHTVSTQLRSAMRKLQVSRRAALAARVLADGALEDESTP